MSTFLIGSASSLKGVEEMLRKFWYMKADENLRFPLIGKNVYMIIKSGKTIEKIKIVKKAQRYRIEGER